MTHKDNWVYFHVSVMSVKLGQVKVLKLSYEKWKNNTVQLNSLVCQAAWHKMLHEMRGTPGDYFRHLFRKHGEDEVRRMVDIHLKYQLVTEDEHELGRLQAEKLQRSSAEAKARTELGGRGRGR